MRVARTGNSILCGLAALATVVSARPSNEAGGLQSLSQQQSQAQQQQQSQAQQQQPPPAPSPTPTPPPVPRHTHAWSRAITAPGVASVAVSPAHIAVAGPEAGLAVYASSDGAPVWSSDKHATLPPVFAGDLVAICTEDGVSAFRASTGAVAWERGEAGAETATALVATGDAIVFVTPTQLRAWALDGSPRWTRTIAGGDAPRAASSRDRLFVSLEGPAIAAVNLATGEVAETVSATSEPLYLSLQGDRLLSGGSDGHVAAYKIAPLSRDWTYQKVGATGPFVADKRFVYTALLDNTLYAFGLGNGHQRWSRQLPTRPRGGPVLVDDRVVVVLADGRLAQYAANEKGTALPEEPSPDASIRVLGIGAAPDGRLIVAIGAPADDSRQLMAWRGAPPQR